MTEQDAALSLAALGHEARLKVFRLLVKAGPEGLPVGEIVRQLGLPPSTLSHHLGALVQAGLVSQERRGRETVNRADFDVMRRLLAFVESECCSGVCAAGTEA